MSIFDLHMHSNHSVDGEFTPKQLIDIAKKANLQCVVLCDHNSCDGVDAFMYHAKEANIISFPGIEFSTSYEEAEVHLLGYNIDYNNSFYKALPVASQELKNETGRQLIHKFNARFNFDLDETYIMNRAKEEDSDPYLIMSELILNIPKYNQHKDLQPYLKGGARSEPATVNLYWDFCVKGCDCFVPIPFPSIKECIERIHNEGGLAILAHPWKTFYQKEDKLLELMEYGIDGIEAYSNYHEDYHNIYYDDFCKKHHLLMTCGSDFHGATKPKIKMGEYGYTKKDEPQVLQSLLKALTKEGI